MADQISAPTQNHQISNITHARMFALVAQDPASWGSDSFAKQLDRIPLTAVERANLGELATYYAERAGPISPGYMRAALQDAGIEPTETNLRKCLPAVAFAKSQACLETNRLTYGEDFSLGWDLPPPLSSLTDGPSRSQPEMCTVPVETAPKMVPSGGQVAKAALGDDRYLDAKLSEVANAVATANVAKGTWSSAIADDVERAFSFLIA